MVKNSHVHFIVSPAGLWLYLAFPWPLTSYWGLHGYDILCMSRVIIGFLALAVPVHLGPETSPLCPLLWYQLMGTLFLLWTSRLPTDIDSWHPLGPSKKSRVMEPSSRFPNGSPMGRVARFQSPLVRGTYRKSWATIFCKVTCFIIDKPNTPP